MGFPVPRSSLIKSFECHIFGFKWKYHLVKPVPFAKAFGEDTAAITFPYPTAHIFFCHGSVDLGLVRHELVHAYLSHLPVGSANLTEPQSEEVTAEFVQYYWDNLDKVAREILKKLKK